MARSPTARNDHNLAATLRLGAAVLLILTVGVMIDSLHPLLRLAGYATLLFITLVWAVASRRQPGGTIPWSLVLLAAVWVWSALRIPASPSLIPALEKVSAQAVPLLVLFVVIQLLRRGWAPKTWLDALILLGLVFSLFEILLAFLWYLNWWSIPNVPSFLPPIGYRASGLLLGHPNILAAYVNLVIPMVLIRAVMATRLRDRLAQIAVALVLLMGLFLSSSRGGWLALAGGLAVVAVVAASWGLQGKLTTTLSGWLKSPLWIGVIVLGGIGILLALAYEFGSTAHLPIISSRSGIWGPALAIFLEHPVLGSGPGSFPFLFASRVKDIPTLGGAHAHNILLQFGVEIGAVGLLLGVLFALAVALHLRSALRKAPAEDRPLLLGCVGALAAFSIHSLFDYLLGPLLFSMALAIMIAQVLAYPGFRTRRGVHLPVKVIAIVLSALLLLPQAIFLPSSLSYWNGVNRAWAGDWGTAVQDICRAAARRPGMALYDAQCGLARWIVENSSPSHPDFSQAIASLSAAVDQGNPWPLHYADLGAAYLKVGDADKAVQNFEKARDAYPERAFLGLALGAAQEQAGRTAEAESTYVAVLRNEPDDAFLAFFQQTEVRRQVADKFVRLVAAQGSAPPLWQAERAYWRGDYAGSLRILESGGAAIEASADTFALKALALQRAGNFDEAQTAAEVAGFIDPSNPHAVYAMWSIETGQAGSQAQPTSIDPVAASVVFENNSSHYYFSAFGRYFGPLDLLPVIPRGEITTWMAESLLSFQAELGPDQDPYSPLSWIVESLGPLPTSKP